MWGKGPEVDRALSAIAAHFQKKEKNPRVGGGRKEPMEEPELDHHSKGIRIKRNRKISHTLREIDDKYVQNMKIQSNSICSNSVKRRQT